METATNKKPRSSHRVLRELGERSILRRINGWRSWTFEGRLRGPGAGRTGNGGKVSLHTEPQHGHYTHVSLR